MIHHDNLPNRASALIRLALSDIRKVEARPEIYEVDMSFWVKPGYGESGQCAVCFAGAVISQTLELGTEVSYTNVMNMFPHSVDRKINALNEFRKGNVEDGMYYFLNDNESYQQNQELFISMDRDVTTYNMDRTKFHADMEKMAQDLEILGY